jgi:hypothetical protein
MSGSVEDAERFEKAAQQRVLDAIDARQVADFSSLSGPQRRLSAEFLQRLISGSSSARGELCCPLRIRGADIVGPLRPPWARRRYRRPARPGWAGYLD